LGQGFQSRHVTLVERGVLGLAITGAVQGLVLAAMVAILFKGGPVELVLRALGVIWLFFAGLFVNLWKGSIERTTVRANRQGLWVGDEFFPSASLDEAHPFLRAEYVFVRVTRRGLHLPLDIGVRDVAEGERLMRALDLDGAGRDDPEIGADGILLRSAGRRRYIHHGAIEHALLVPGTDRIELLLSGGERVVLTCRDGRGPATLREIEQAMAACAANETEADAPRLYRGGRSVRGWIAELRALGAGANAAHRVAPFADERLWRIVESPATQPTVRAAAAVALGPRLDPRDRVRLRAAALATTAPRLRTALEAAAGSARDAELEALLAEVEEEDAPSPRHRVAPGVRGG
jgi:hypothetical protein